MSKYRLVSDFTPHERIEIVAVTILDIHTFRRWLEAVVRKIVDPALIAILLAAVLEALIHLSG